MTALRVRISELEHRLSLLVTAGFLTEDQVSDLLEESPRTDEKTGRYCCFIPCDQQAEFQVITIRAGDHESKGITQVAGPDQYSDFTDACEDHVGHLLGTQPECVNPEECFWQVWPIENADR